MSKPNKVLVPIKEQQSCVVLDFKYWEWISSVLNVLKEDVTEKDELAIWDHVINEIDRWAEKTYVGSPEIDDEWR